MPTPAQPAPQQQSPPAAQSRYVEMPDGSYAEWPQGVSAEDFRAHYKLPPPDTRNFVQKSFDENTTPTPGEPLLETGLKSVANAIGSPFIHPKQGLESSMESLYSPVTAGYKTAKGMYDDYKSGGLPYAMTKAAGNIFGGMVLGGAVSAIPNLRIPEPIAGYRSPVIDPALQNASKVASAIHPPGGINTTLIPELAVQVPKIKGYAAETGNPFHSAEEMELASRGLGERGLEHYKTNFADPFETDRISMRTVPEYQGPVSGEGRMTTLGDIENRITAINKLTRPAYGAATTGKVLTDLERLGLDNEATKLRSILYNEISKRTGVSPEEVKDLREGYGQQFNIADAIGAAQRERLGQIGAAKEGTSVPTNRSGVVNEIATRLRGGREYLANRNLRRAMELFQPEQSNYPSPQVQRVLQQSRQPIWAGIQNEKPPVMQPQPMESQVPANLARRAAGRQVMEAQAAQNRQAAQTEATRMHEGENAAQDASLERSKQAQAAREAIRQARRDKHPVWAQK